MRYRRAVVILLAVVIVVAVSAAAIWDFSEPWTSAYELNPVTLEMREVEYIDRPITGLSQRRVLRTKEMAIGRWLKDNGYLQNSEATSGYWVLVKSYNSRWGFEKGIGRSLQPVFDQSGVLTPMPHPSVDSKNQEWVDWCTANPERANWVWTTYSELADNPKHLDCAADVLWFALYHSGNIADSEFVPIMRLRMQDCDLSD